MTDIINRIADQRIIPVLVVEDASASVPLASALRDGGLPIIEVTLRTDAALDVIRLSAETPGVMVGAGTVLNADQCQAAIDAGAGFIVSPGFDEAVIAKARDNDVAVIPGIATISELQRAWNLGLRTVKFFPANIAGGPAAIEAFASVLSDMTFMPTGGVTADNIASYLSIDAVIACGGSWVAPKDLITAQRFDDIENRAKNARTIVMQNSDT